MASITWTENALNDIDNIASYISKDSEFYAKQFVRKLIDATLKLERFPEIGGTIRELPQSNYKQILFKKYRIIYRIENDKIYIITVHHSARLLENNDTFRDLSDE
ncbi:type II toxin-antitoxin system RelE/ParE family toxin [Parafilimonas terrae]|uniref:Addiction module toxin, RelE/StbE family n=1 Tax=Parafilimonas terrae TaxID=1465490 RepID=A0A1I5V7F3_9BACT|nr:type II toxin-antitoxin system RelE/ParE family toxin [Parafilimonas terrae]SFQ03435.1 addiction module toxin, RelE/StbE family [Parafilimonas terrae]